MRCESATNRAGGAHGKQQAVQDTQTNRMGAYTKVKANKGSAGIDGMNFEKYEESLKNNLYKLWNRMSSGSYFPKAVKAVEIPKKNGGVRRLGIPTIDDRIAQMTAKMMVEPLLDPKFHEDSYGYRPNKDELFRQVQSISNEKHTGLRSEKVNKMGDV